MDGRTARARRGQVPKSDHEPLLLKTSLEPAGHGGASGRYDVLKEVAFDYALLLSVLGRPESR